MATESLFTGTSIWKDCSVVDALFACFKTLMKLSWYFKEIYIIAAVMIVLKMCYKTPVIHKKCLLGHISIVVYMCCMTELV